MTDYATRAEFKARFYPTGSTADTVDDAVIDQILTAISRQIDQETGRRFDVQTGATKTFTAACPDRLWIEDLLLITTLKTDNNGDGTYETTWSTTDYLLWPLNAAVQAQEEPYQRIDARWNSGKRFPSFQSGVQIVGNWGYASAVPPAITDACLMWSARIFERREAIFGVQGGGPFGTVTTNIPPIDPDIRQKLALFRRGQDVV